MGMGNGYLDNKNMKVSMLMIGEMDKECTSGATKVIIKVILQMIRDMDSEKCTGMKMLFTEAPGKKAFSQGKDSYGKMVK